MSFPMQQSTSYCMHQHAELCIGFQDFIPNRGQTLSRKHNVTAFIVRVLLHLLYSLSNSGEVNSSCTFAFQQFDMLVKCRNTFQMSKWDLEKLATMPFFRFPGIISIRYTTSRLDPMRD